MTGAVVLQKSKLGDIELVREWLIAEVSSIINIDKERVDTKKSFESYGIDSAAIVGLVAEMEDWAGVEIDPTVAYDYPSINELSTYLASAFA